MTTQVQFSTPPHLHSLEQMLQPFTKHILEDLFQQPPTFLEETYAGNTVHNYIFSLILLAITFSLAMFFKLVLKIMLNLTQKTENDVDDFVVSLFLVHLDKYVVLSLSLWAATRVLFLNPIISSGLSILFQAIFTYQVVHAILDTLDFILHKWVDKNGKRQQSVKHLMKVLRLVVWGWTLVFVLDNFGFDVTAVIAGFGVSGLIITLASKAILIDAFSSLIIFLDEPFKVGDFIEVSGTAGNVETIGVKTTRVRSIEGEAVLFSNTELLSAKIKNYEEMNFRRGNIQLSLPLDTSRSKILKLGNLTAECAKKVDLLEIKRTFLSKISEYSLVWEIIFVVNSSNMNTFCDKKQQFMLSILEMLEEENIKLAIPLSKLIQVGEK